MAADSPQVPDGFELATPEGPDDEGDVKTINGDGPMEPGTVLQGLVLDVRDGENSNGPWYILRIKDEAHGVIDYFAKGDVKQFARAGRIEIGEPIWIAKSNDEQSFTNDDGDDVTFYPTNCAFPGGD